MKKIYVFKLFSLFTFLYFSLLALIWKRQEQLLFKPDPFSRVQQLLDALRVSRKTSRRMKEWRFTTSDGHSIQGFFSYPPAHHTPTRTVVYFGGIREECSWALEHAHHFPDALFVCLNYRGYGLSQGAPSQESILNDTQSALHFLIREHHIPSESLYFVGRSLGSGVVGFLSTQFQPKAVCLVTPYDSVLAVAKRKYWFIPVQYLFRHPFEALPWAQQNHAPMMMLLSEIDETVPHEHSARLFQAWAGPKESLTLPDTDHSTIVLSPSFFPTIASFFKHHS